MISIPVCLGFVPEERSVSVPERCKISVSAFEDKRARLGDAAAQPHRIKYRQLTRG